MSRLLRLLPAAPLLFLAPPLWAAEGEAAGAGVTQLDPFHVPIVDGSRIVGRLDLLVAVEPDAQGHGPIVQPVVRAALFSAMIEFARLHASTRLPIDVGALSGALDNAVQQAHGGAGKVLLLEVRTYPDQ
ncbi:hypothetical protein KY084_06120 [Stakelama sp. CBK3Z-3]|uniref:Uncharacterized protein n=1 Tax=Stakelama flava TaxID=2860338 RepID=A0ABS6XJR4_9SPHN|nr:hypothetical protein [Stakelama flava]MBW4330449.1 hypothetical protein [Stakelama flava]